MAIRNGCAVQRERGRLGGGAVVVCEAWEAVKAGEGGRDCAIENVPCDNARESLPSSYFRVETW